MAYRTKVEVRTKGKIFPSGSILPKDISESDLVFLKTKKFLEVVEGSSVNDEEEEECYSGDDFEEMNPGEYKTAEEVKKIRKKEDVYTYAASIDFDLGDDYKEKSLTELQEDVINYQEEVEAGVDNEG